MAIHHVQTVVRLWRRDREGTEDYTRLHFPTSIAPESAIVAALADFAAASGALSDSPLSAVDIEFVYVDDGAPPLGDPDLSQVGALFFSCAADNQLVLNVPALLDSCYLVDGVTIDVDQVGDLVAELLAPGAALVCNPFDSAVVSYESGLRRVIPVLFAEATG